MSRPATTRSVSTKLTKRGVSRAGEGPRSIDVTPDGKRLAVGRAEGVAVCDRQGNVLFEIVNESRQPLELDNNDRLTFFGHYSFGRFSPDGKTLAAVTSDRPDEIRVFDARDGPRAAKNRARIANGPVGLLARQQADRRHRARQRCAPLRRRYGQAGLVAGHSTHQSL